jgi:NAD(P) transhydrogenase
MDSFDLVVIGGGAAGEKGAVQAAYFGKKVALIEKEPVHGGAMVNTGTLPSKTLRETALTLSGFRQRGLDGVDFGLSRQASVKDLLTRLGRVVAEERTRLRANLNRHNVTTFEGAARFVDAHTIGIDRGGTEYKIEAKHVLIATGSRPVRPALFPFDLRSVYDSDEIVNVDEIPKSMLVVGGGVIGCEYACIFATLGTKVTIVETRDSILGFLDEEMIEALTARMTALGIDLRTSTSVTKCEATRDHVALELSPGGRLEADVVLVCAGRQAATASLNLAAAGISAGKRGQLDVDAQFATTVKHISACGDVIGFPSLASTSMEQARVAVVHFFDLGYKKQVARIFPYGIYTIPEVSMAGETEAALREKKVDYVKGVANFGDNARGLIIGEHGKLKLLFDRTTMKLLGVHCIGEGATELIHVGLLAMMREAGADLFIETCFNYPTLAEAYKYATYDALGRRGRAT